MSDLQAYLTKYRVADSLCITPSLCVYEYTLTDKVGNEFLMAFCGDSLVCLSYATEEDVVTFVTEDGIEMALLTEGSNNWRINVSHDFYSLSDLEAVVDKLVTTLVQMSIDLSYTTFKSTGSLPNYRLEADDETE